MMNRLLALRADFYINRKQLTIGVGWGVGSIRFQLLFFTLWITKV